VRRNKLVSASVIETVCSLIMGAQPPEPWGAHLFLKLPHRRHFLTAAQAGHTEVIGSPWESTVNHEVHQISRCPVSSTETRSFKMASLKHQGNVVFQVGERALPDHVFCLTINTAIVEALNGVNIRTQKNFHLQSKTCNNWRMMTYISGKQNCRLWGNPVTPWSVQSRGNFSLFHKIWYCFY
jgi:hypothetical protein